MLSRSIEGSATFAITLGGQPNLIFSAGERLGARDYDQDPEELQEDPRQGPGVLGGAAA